MPEEAQNSKSNFSPEIKPLNYSPGTDTKPNKD